jgi:probable HAF family extracellular repeat protein
VRRVTLGFFALSATAALLLGCDSNRPLEPSHGPDALARVATAQSGFATLSTLPALSKGVHGEAYAVTQAGSIIAGYSWDRAGRMNPVTWRLQTGAWRITALPYVSSATSATARAVNDQGDVAGNDFPASTPHVVLWPSTGGFNVLGCSDLGEAYGISAGGRTVVGVGRGVSPATAAVWQPGLCRKNLPALVAGGSASARAVNGNGTIVGGSAAPNASSTSSVPVRWRRVADAWQIEKLDSRPGTVHGANSAGDLVGSVQVPCASQSGCNRGIVWYAAGGSRELGTLGGESTVPRGINAAGEVVGSSALANGVNTAFFWSATRGMRQLPVTDGAWAFAVSGVRSDGTRLVVGAGGKPFAALVWVVRNP